MVRRPISPSYMDLGSLAPATTPNWFDAYSPTTLKQYAGFGDVTYTLTDALKVDVGARVNHYDYRFSSCISGWGSGNGAASASCSGLIALSSTSFNPKFNLTYTLSPDLMAYATVSTRIPSRRGKRGLSDHRGCLGRSFPAAGLHEW